MSTTSTRRIWHPSHPLHVGSAPGEAHGGSECEYSLDQLAAATGSSPRTIRFYRHSGLIGPPRRDGRRALYNADELARLRTILTLRDRGFGLDAIAHILENPSAAHDSLTVVLRMSDALREPWIDDKTVTLSELQVLETLGSPTRDVILFLERSSLLTRVTPRSKKFHVPSVVALELVGDLLAAGIAPEVAVSAWEITNRHLAALAHDLVERFAASATEGATPFTLTDLADAYSQLRPIALRAVHLVFAHQIEDSLTAFVEQGAFASLAIETTPDGPKSRTLDRR